MQEGSTSSSRPPSEAGLAGCSREAVAAVLSYPPAAPGGRPPPLPRRQQRHPALQPPPSPLPILARLSAEERGSTWLKRSSRWCRSCFKRAPPWWLTAAGWRRHRCAGPPGHRRPLCVSHWEIEASYLQWPQGGPTQIIKHQTCSALCPRLLALLSLPPPRAAGGRHGSAGVVRHSRGGAHWRPAGGGVCLCGSGASCHQVPAVPARPQVSGLRRRRGGGPRLAGIECCCLYMMSTASLAQLCLFLFMTL